MSHKLLSRLRELDILGCGQSICANDVIILISKASALKQLRRELGPITENLRDADLLTGKVTINGEDVSVVNYIKDRYAAHFTTLTPTVVNPILHILKIYATGKKVNISDVPKDHAAILRARSVYRTEIIRSNISADTIAYFVGSNHLVIINSLRKMANIMTLSGIIERTINGRDISKYRNVLPCMMYFSGDDVRTLRSGTCTLQYIDGSNPSVDIRLVDEVEQTMGESAEHVNERTWCTLMMNYGVHYKTSFLNHYAEVNYGTGTSSQLPT